MMQQILYAETAILTTSTDGYKCVIFDEDTVPIDNKGLIMLPNVSTPYYSCYIKSRNSTKIYKFKLTYEP